MAPLCPIHISISDTFILAGTRVLAPIEDGTALAQGFDEEKTDCSGSDCSGSETDCSGSDCSGKEGFNTLSYGDVNNMSTIDTISTVNGSMTCLSHSSNLTNSTGPLCLSREQIMSIKTRGGNASCPSI